MTADAPTTPTAEVEIDEALIRGLLGEQHPDLAALSIRLVDAGWDNVMARLGDALAVRLPRRALAVPLLLNEQRWLPVLAPTLPLPIPAPVRVGVPSERFPFPWSVTPWLPGEPADLAPPHRGQVDVLVDFFRALHVAAPADAPANPVRGCPLAAKAVDVERRMALLEAQGRSVDVVLRKIWDAGVRAPIDEERTWIAGDVHARNVLVDGDSGAITAFIDWGDMCAGDRATDFASLWGLFADKDARKRATVAARFSDATLARAKAWATFYGVVLLQTGLLDTPRHAAMGERILERLVEDGAP